MTEDDIAQAMLKAGYFEVRYSGNVLSYCKEQGRKATTYFTKVVIDQDGKVQTQCAEVLNALRSSESGA